MLTSQAVWVASDLPFRGFAKSDIAYIIYNTSKPAVRGNNNKNNTTATETEGQQVLSVMSSTTTATTTTTTTAKTLMTMTASDKIHVQTPMSKQQADPKSAHNNQRQRRILFHSHVSPTTTATATMTAMPTAMTAMATTKTTQKQQLQWWTINQITSIA